MTTKDEITAELKQTLWMSTDEIVEGIPEAAANIAKMIEAKDEQIAALQERNAFLQTSAETAQAKLAEARAEVDTIKAMRNLEVQPELSDALGRISELEAEVERLENARWDQG